MLGNDDGFFADHLTDKVNEGIASPARFKAQDDMANLMSCGLNTVDIYTASCGTALKVVSENRGRMRDTANPDRPEDPFGVTPADALAVARKEVMYFRTAQIAGCCRQRLSDPLTWLYILAQDGAGGVTMPFDEAKRFARAIGVELGGNDAKRILETKSGRVTLKSGSGVLAGGHHLRGPGCRHALGPGAHRHRHRHRYRHRRPPGCRNRPPVAGVSRPPLAGRRVPRHIDPVLVMPFAVVSGHRWQDGEFRATLDALRDALRQIRKPGHPDEAGAGALHALPYEQDAPCQEQLIASALPGASYRRQRPHGRMTTGE